MGCTCAHIYMRMCMHMCADVRICGCPNMVMAHAACASDVHADINYVLNVITLNVKPYRKLLASAASDETVPPGTLGVPVRRRQSS